MNSYEETSLLTIAQQYLQTRNTDLARKTLLKILQKNVGWGDNVKLMYSWKIIITTNTSC